MENFQPQKIVFSCLHVFYGLNIRNKPYISFVISCTNCLKCPLTRTTLHTLHYIHYILHKRDSHSLCYLKKNSINRRKERMSQLAVLPSLQHLDRTVSRDVTTADMLTSGITLRWVLRKYCIRTGMDSPRSSRTKTLVLVNMGTEALVLQKGGDCKFELPKEESLKLKLFVLQSVNPSSVCQIKEV